MAITKVINDAVDLNQTSDYSGLRLPVGTTGNVVESFTTDYLVVGGGGGGGQGYYGGGGGAGGLRTSYNNSTTTTNSLAFPSGKTAVATYMLDNNATDISGNYNGTETNITYNTGQYGGAAVFNGSSSYINLPNLGTEVSGSNTRTLSAWVKLDSNPSVYSAVVSYGAAANLQSFGIYISSTGTPRVSYYNINYDTSTTLTLSNWHHIVGIYKGGNVQTTANTELYIDGQIQTLTATNSLNLTGPINTSNTNYAIGYYRASPSGSYFNGDIDQVRIYDTALSSTDVSNIYNNEVQALSGGGSAAESSLTLSEGVAYDVTVGAGAIGGNTQSGTADNGNNSIFSTITSIGGGGGQNRAGSFGSSGGSGGGAAFVSDAGGNGTLNQGYAGGSLPALRYGAGGGGASEIGLIPLTDYDQDQRNSIGAPGGDGLSVSITGIATYYSGGGGGGARNPGPDTGVSGGLGGGGDGGLYVIGDNGFSNTGGGGGGGGNDASNGGDGGSGVVILRYPTASVSSFTTTGTLNTPSTTNTVADNNYPTTNTAYYQLDGNANGYLTTNDLGTLDYPSGTGCIALYELNGNANGYLTTTDLSTVNYPVGAGCVALYELNGNANDTSNTYNGSAVDVTYDDGAFDQAAVFNGSSSKIVATNPVSQEPFSVSMWVNYTETRLYKAFIGIGNNTTNAKFFINTQANGGLAAAFQHNGSYIFNFTHSTTGLNDGGWHHLAFSWDGTTNTNAVKFYIDEILTSSTSTLAASSTNAFTELVIGTTTSTSASMIEGNIDQVRIFNTALTQAQVTTLARGVGSAYNGAETNITYNTGAFGKAAVFNGSSSKIDTSLSLDTNNISGGSISFWFNTSQTTPVQILIGSQTAQNGSSYGTSILLGAATGSSTSESISVWDYNGGTTSAFYTEGGSSFYQDGAWHHLVITSTSSTKNIYIDGVSQTISYTGSGSASANLKFTDIQIGATLGYTGTNYFDGSIDQVRIFNTALSASDVTALARGAGTAYNGAASNVTWLNGRFGQAAVFSANGYISGLPTVQNTSGEFSVSMWFNTTVNPSVQQTMLGGIKEQGSNDSVFAFKMLNDGYSKLYLRGTDGTLHVLADTIDATDGNWHHLVGTVSSSSGVFYVDGQQVDSATISNNITVDNLLIGAENNRGTLSPVNYFNGKIDQMRIFSSALTSSQVTELYEEHYQTKFTDGSDTAIVFTEGTGTVTFSGVNPAPPQGALRTNTSYSEDGSASVIEHYNGTDWKRFDAIKYCTTNTLNFPSGAGCIASYNLDNNVNDIGNTYNGVNSNVTFNASGKFGAAAVFNGSSSVITLPALPITTSSNVTFSAWIKGSTDATDATIVSTLAENGLEFRVINSTVRAVYRKGSSWYASSAVSITADAWNHVVLTYEQGVGFNIYVNNNTPTIYAETGTLSILGSSNTIGKYADGSSGYFDGSIDQVRIFNDSLTSAEVSKLYNNEIACS
jgi:hypothetical protein